jgi:hypothetical protein
MLIITTIINMFVEGSSGVENGNGCYFIRKRKSKA